MPRPIRARTSTAHDAAAKLVVLAGIAFRRHVRLSDVPQASIRPLTTADFRYAKRLGCTIRQMSQVQAVGDGFHAFVGPGRSCREGSSFGRNEGANNVVSIFGQYGGESSFSGAGAGGPATAVAVVSDLLALTPSGAAGEAEEWLPASPVAPPARPYYLRFVVHDRPGILATIAAALARQGVNLDAVLQEPGYPKDRLPFVITVEPCEEAALQAALEEIAQADWHAEPPLALPMLVGGNVRDIVFVSCHLRRDSHADLGDDVSWCRVRSPIWAAASIRSVWPFSCTARPDRRRSRRRRQPAGGDDEHPPVQGTERARARIRGHRAGGRAVRTPTVVVEVDERHSDGGRAWQQRRGDGGRAPRLRARRPARCRIDASLGVATRARRARRQRRAGAVRRPEIGGPAGRAAPIRSRCDGRGPTSCGWWSRRPPSGWRRPRRGRRCPLEVPRADAIFNLQRVLALVHALQHRDYDTAARGGAGPLAPAGACVARAAARRGAGALTIRMCSVRSCRAPGRRWRCWRRERRRGSSSCWRRMYRAAGVEATVRVLSVHEDRARPRLGVGQATARSVAATGSPERRRENRMKFVAGLTCHLCGATYPAEGAVGVQRVPGPARGVVRLRRHSRR